MTFTTPPSISVKDMTSHEIKSPTLQDAASILLDFGEDIEHDKDMKIRFDKALDELEQLYREAVKKGYIEAFPLRGRSKIGAGFYYCPHIPENI